MNKIKLVYHGEHGLRTMKDLARSYLTITKDLARVILRRLPKVEASTQMIQ